MQYKFTDDEVVIFCGSEDFFMVRSGISEGGASIAFCRKEFAKVAKAFMLEHIEPTEKDLAE